MKYILSKEVLEKFPSTTLCIIPVRGIDNTALNREIVELQRDAEKKTRAEFGKTAISEHPRIKCWRQAFSAFGAKPKKYHCSIEAMVKRIMEEEGIPSINNLVNLYNYISLKHLVSVGGDDADKIDGNVTLALAKGNEPFQEMGTTETTHPHEGEAIFRDEKEVLCRRWNWHQCEKTKITEQTKNVNLQFEGIAPVGKKEIEEAAEETQKLLKKHFNKETKTYFINKENPSLELP